MQLRITLVVIVFEAYAKGAYAAEPRSSIAGSMHRRIADTRRVAGPVTHHG
jgi:hypothetical protein